MKTHCCKGHRYTAANTYYVAKSRRCRACISAQRRRRYENDEVFRERKKANARRRWKKLRELEHAQRPDRDPDPGHDGLPCLVPASVLEYT